MNRCRTINIFIFVVSFIIVTFIYISAIREFILKFYKTRQVTVKRMNFIKYQDFCINEYDVHNSLIKNAEKIGDNVTDDKLDKNIAFYGICLLKKMGIINENGDIIWKVARNELPGLTQERINDIYNACKNISGMDYERAYELFKCFLQNKVDPSIK